MKSSWSLSRGSSCPASGTQLNFYWVSTNKTHDRIDFSSFLRREKFGKIKRKKQIKYLYNACATTATTPTVHHFPLFKWKKTLRTWYIRTEKSNHKLSIQVKCTSFKTWGMIHHWSFITKYTIFKCVTCWEYTCYKLKAMKKSVCLPKHITNKVIMHESKPNSMPWPFIFLFLLLFFDFSI